MVKNIGNLKIYKLSLLTIFRENMKLGQMNNTIINNPLGNSLTSNASTSLSNFLATKEKEILSIAHRNTDEIVKTELALIDFELLLAVSISKKESGNLTKIARKLRCEGWQELSKKFKGNSQDIQKFVDTL